MPCRFVSALKLAALLVVSSSPALAETIGVATDRQSSKSVIANRETETLEAFARDVGINPAELSSLLGGGVQSPRERTIAGVFCVVHQRFESRAVTRQDWVAQLQVRLSRQGKSDFK